MKERKIHILAILHLMLMVYSMSGILSKKAAGADFLSIQFCIYYSGIIVLLGLYAVAWQQILKFLPISIAFANKAVTVVWGIVWGNIFFHESIQINNVIGALLVIIGVVIYSLEE